MKYIKKELLDILGRDTHELFPFRSMEMYIFSNILFCRQESSDEGGEIDICLRLVNTLTLSYLQI